MFLKMEQFDEFILYTILEYADVHIDDYDKLHKYSLHHMSNIAVANMLRLCCRKFYKIISSRIFRPWTINLMFNIDGIRVIPRLHYLDNPNNNMIAYVPHVMSSTVIPKFPTIIDYLDLQRIGGYDYVDRLIQIAPYIRSLYIEEHCLSNLYDHNFAFSNCEILLINDEYYGTYYLKCFPNVVHIKNTIDFDDVTDKMTTINVYYGPLFDMDKKFPNAKNVMIYCDDIDGFKKFRDGEFHKVFPNAKIDIEDPDDVED